MFVLLFEIVLFYYLNYKFDDLAFNNVDIKAQSFIT